MNGAAFFVSQAGPLVTIQDSGRPGLMRFGVPQSGPMDRFSFAIANLALGNPSGAPAIEISIGGLALECVEGCVTVAVAGGGFEVELDGIASSGWFVATIRAGQRIAIRRGHWGSWAYLACAGTLEAGTWLGSAATHGSSGFGGGALKPGQNIAVLGAEVRTDCEGEIARPVSARPKQIIRAIPGPQDRFFSRKTLDTLFTELFVLTDAYDRMGVRLRGPLLSPQASLDMPSEPITRGSIQVSGDGVPTVLLADHQTTGGYPKIATVLPGDLDSFVQLRSRSPVTFKRISPEAAIAAVRTRRHVEARYVARLKERRRGGEV